MSAPVQNYAGVAKALYPAEGSGNQTFNNYFLAAICLIPQAYLVFWTFGMGLYTYLFVTLLWAPTAFGLVIFTTSYLAVPHNSPVKMPGNPVQSYLNILDPAMRDTYCGSNRIPMETFFEAYFDGKIDLADGRDCLEVFEHRHDWARFSLTWGQVKFFFFTWIPELLFRNQLEDEHRVRETYDRGNDFYGAFLGESMVYTSGVISDPSKEETLEELQENKLRLICDKMAMKPGERHLDIGCGWGTLTNYAAKNYATHSTGVSIAKHQIEYAEAKTKEAGIQEGDASFLCMDYRNIPSAKYDKITCVEMAEHVGIRHFQTFLAQIRELLQDDGLFYMQVSGLRATWQYEDFIWGLFMARYIFPLADASTPLYWYVKQLEESGFEVKSVDTVGVHYSSTLWHWYRNWMSNRTDIEAKYGKRWFRIFEVF
ncbi:S-adenosyl-L-methionine-dependent methyltransferase, partial [Piptocephalis cylindrospora]